MDLKEAVLQAQRGDAEAFHRLVEAKKGDLYKVAYCYTRNKEDALDLVSETVYKAFVSLKKLKRPQYFNTWLTRILINTALNHLKKTGRTVPLEENRAQAPPAYREGISADEVDRLDLMQALERLDDPLKTVVILKYFQDLTLTEVAEVLECPVGTAKSYLHRALKILRLELKEDCT